jgi:glycosyltransferase involved in cell wall biosynthesis
MYYQNRYHVESSFIPYGATIMNCPPGTTLERFGLEPNKYILFVGRLVPENGPHHLVQAFEELYKEGVTGDMKLVVVGDAPYQEKYIASLKHTSTPNIIFTGYVFGDGYRELSSNAYLFAVTTEAGGTHPVLLESMAFGNCVIVNDTPDNLEVIGEAAIPYSGAEGSVDLKRTLKTLLENPASLERYRHAAVERIRKNYDWQIVTDAYEQLFARLQTDHAARSKTKVKTHV